MSPSLHTAFLLLGSNIEDRKSYIKKAISLISSNNNKVVTSSDYYFSESWGYDDEDYLNLALEIQTPLSPTELLSTTQCIEKTVGRTAKTQKGYEARIIDIDILFYENKIIETSKLTLPHPRLHLRNFVLFPLAEIAPNFQHPVFEKTIEELKTNCKDNGKVWS